MLKLKRALAMLLAIMMMMSGVVFAEEGQIAVSEAAEVHVHEEPAAEVVKEAAEEPEKEPVEEPAEEPAEEPVEEPAEEPVEEPAEEPTEEPAVEPVEEPAEEPVEEPAEEPVEEPAEEPAEFIVESKADECANGHSWVAWFKVDDEGEQYLYSECSVCGAENTCAHELTTAYTDRVEVSVTAQDADSHSLRFIPVEGVECKLCGIEAMRSGEVDTVTDEAHVPEGNVCKWCGEPVACSHANYQVTDTFNTNYEYVPVDAKTHSMIYDVQEERLCLDCGNWIYVTISENVAAEPQKHYFDFKVVFDANGKPGFSDGACDSCGYVSTCDHSVVATGEEIYIIEDSIKNDGETHSYEYYNTVEYSCSICNAYASVVGEEKQSATGEAHEYDDGVCDVCGAKNTCEHANSEFVYHEDFYEYDLDDTQETADTHFFKICYAADIMHCNDCESDWFVLDDEPNYVNQAVAHAYDREGVCYVCYRPNDCTHENVEYNYNDYDLADDLDGYIIRKTVTTHTVLGYKYTAGECADCGQEVLAYEDGVAEITEPHRFNIGEEACFICGYVPSCAHEKVTTSTAYSYGNPVMVNSQVHKRPMEKVEITTCVACGKTDIKTISTETVYENHSNYDGVCDCGYEFDCEHKNLAEPETTHSWNYEGVPAEGGHTITYTYYETVRCLDCGGIVSQTKIKTEDKLEPHILDAGNTCTSCGFVSECAHAEFEYADESGEFCEAFDTQYHRMISYLSRVAYCKECKQRLNDYSYFEYNAGAKEPHKFANGKCSECGLYEVTCEHDYEDGACTICGAACPHKFENGVCTLCGAACTDHTYENGACTICGAACPHANTTTASLTRKANYKALCADKHSYDLIAVVETTCSDCGHVSTADAEDAAPVAGEEACTDADQDEICDYCNAAMGRVHSGEVVFVETVFEVSAEMVEAGLAEPVYVEYASNGDSTHTVYRFVGYNVYACAACGEKKNVYDGLYGTALAEISENCTYVSGECTACGAPMSGCEHEWAEGICTICGAALREVEEIIVAKSIKVGYGLKQALRVEIEPADATVPLTYSSSDKKIVKVDKDGVITGFANGTAKITITAKNPSGNTKTAKIEVTVTAAPASVALQSNSPKGGYLLCVGESFDLTATVTKASALYDLTWTTDEQDEQYIGLVITGDNTATVTGKKSGEVTVTVATQNNKKDTFKFKVVDQPDALKLNAESVPLGVGQTFQIEHSFSPEDTGSYVRYSTGDEGIATVDKNGVITATSKGAATITVSGFGVENTMQVVVVDAPSRVRFNRTAITARKSEGTITLKPILEMGEESSFTYTSSNKNVATVKKDENGNALVTLKKTGTATITVKTYNGKKATCKITVVSKAPTSFSVTPAEIKVAKGDQAKVSFKFKSGQGYSGIQMRESEYASYEDGVITGLKVNAIPGTAPAELTFFYPGKTELEAKNKVSVTVLPEIQDVKLFSGTGTDKSVLSVGQTITLGYMRLNGEIQGQDCGYGSYRFKSSNTKVATVNQSGKVTAKGKGTAQIIFTSYNGHVDVYDVEVKAAPSKLSLSKTSVTLGKGETFRVAVTPKTKAGEETVTAIKVKSSSTKIAKIAAVEGAEGYVYEITAVGEKLGTATLTFTSHNGKTATMKVTVKKAPTSIKLNAPELFLGAGQKESLKATLNSGAGSQITWTSSDDNVVTVENGKLTAVAKGEAIITAATFNSDVVVPATCKVYVSNAPASIRITAPDKIMSVGQKMPISVELLDEEGNTANGTFTVVSKRSSYVSVKTMQLTAKKATSKPTDIVVTAYNHTDEQPVTATYTISEVMAAPTALYFYKTDRTKVNSVTIGVGEELKINMKHDKSEDTPVDYSISAKPKATIATASGFVQPADQLVIKGEGAGTTKLTVKSHNGKTASLTIYVKAAPTAIELGSDVKLCVDETYTIPVKFTPSNAYANVKWDEGANEGIMSFKNGKITALEPGSLTITANTYVEGVSDSIHLQVYSKPVELGTEVEDNRFEIGVPAFGKIEGLNLNNFIVRYTDDGESHYYGKLTVSGLSDSEKKVATIASDGSFNVKKAGTIKFNVKAYSGAELKDVTIRFFKVDPTL